MSKLSSATVATLLIVVAVLGLVAGAFIVKSENISLDLSGLSGLLGILQSHTAVTTVVTTMVYGQVVTQVVGPSSPSPTGASCQIAISNTDINAGEHIAGQLTSNRAGVEVILYQRLMGESPKESLHGITDASGKYYAASGAIDTPGIYQLLAVMNFPAQGITVPCTPVPTITVHGFKISVDPDSIPAGVSTAITLELFSDRPNAHMTIEWRDASSPPPALWAVYSAATTNAGGHATITVPLLSAHVTSFVFRGHDSNIGDYTTNEEWLAIT